MDIYRLKHTIGLCLCAGSKKRADYIRKHKLFFHMGKNCSFMGRILPLYSELISFGNNVWTASNVSFITHDAIHHMLSNFKKKDFNELVGCIEVEDNVFIGSNTTILPGVKIGSNTIIGTRSLVTRSLPSGYVWAGTPVKKIGNFDDFLKKRESLPKHKAKDPNKGLTTKELELLWYYFHKKSTY